MSQLIFVVLALALVSVAIGVFATAKRRPLLTNSAAAGTFGLLGTEQLLTGMPRWSAGFAFLVMCANIVVAIIGYRRGLR
jgi:hypothetical protein